MKVFRKVITVSISCFLLIGIIVGCQSTQSIDPHPKKDVNTITNVQFNGIYREFNGDYSSYLRFYEDGTVISVSSTGKPSEIKNWFSREHKNIDKGTYFITGENISFSLDLVDYIGKVDNEQIILTSNLRSEGKVIKDRKFMFHAIDYSKMYVIAESGLVLREGAGRAFPKIILLPMNSIVTIIEKSDIHEIISGKKGQWVKIIINNDNLNTKIEGWCFDAFLGYEPILRDSDMQYTGDPNGNLRLDVWYYNGDAKDIVQPRIKTNYFSGSSESFYEVIIFKPNNKFQYIMVSRHSFDRGESFNDKLLFEGTYLIDQKKIYLKYEQCRKVNSCSSEDDRFEEIPLNTNRCPNILVFDETDKKSYIKSSEGRVYIANKR